MESEVSGRKGRSVRSEMLQVRTMKLLTLVRVITMRMRMRIR